MRFPEFFDYRPNKKIIETLKKEDDKVCPPKPELKDRYGWIEGYKGTNSKMQCANDFQFELNKEYSIDGEAELCENGFHFCFRLEDVFRYYYFNTENRFFKVKAYINISEFERQQQRNIECYDYYRGSKMLDKFVASKIILTEELGYQELRKYIEDKYFYATTEQYWERVKQIGYDKFKLEYFMEGMKDSMFGENFLLVLFNEIKNTFLFERTINFAKSLQDENVSKDMAVYLILQHIKDKS